MTYYEYQREKGYKEFYEFSDDTLSDYHKTPDYSPDEIEQIYQHAMELQTN